MLPKYVRLRLPPIALGLVALPLVAACGGGKSAQEKQLDELRDELSRVQQTSDRFEERLGKLEIDEADGSAKGDTAASPAALPPARSKAAPVATPQLRVVRIGPDGAEETRASSETASEASDPNDTTPRPVIRIQGAGSEGSIVDEKGRRARRGGARTERIEETIPAEGSPAVTDARTGTRPSALDADARRAYDAALALVNARKFPEALDAFAGFLVRWPDHPNADNAMFWRGECYFAQGEFNRAAEQYEGVLARFPLGNKVPDALLKLGMARAKLGNPQASREAFDKLRHEHPRSEAARRIPSEETP